jgi:intein-encoded DNA endonuclease-like protein
MNTYSLDQYNKSIRLKKEGKGSVRISKILKIPRSTIEGWINQGRKPYYFSEKRINVCNSKENIKRMREMNKITQPKATKISAKLRTKHLPDSAKKYSRELGYIIGVILGDGHVSIKQRRVILSVTDKDFVLEFKKNIEKWSNFKTRFYSRSIKTDEKIKNRKLQWVCYIDSKKASEFLHNLDFRELAHSNEEIKCVFLKGFFDSEGSVFKSSFGIAGYSTDYLLISFVSELLTSLGIYSTLNKRKPTNKDISNKFCYTLAIYRKDSILNFYKFVGFSIERKQNRLVNQVNTILNNRK